MVVSDPSLAPTEILVENCLSVHKCQRCVGALDNTATSSSIRTGVPLAMMTCGLGGVLKTLDVGSVTVAAPS
jgi:hypothetical protein